jgi:hypothetical protein
MSKTVSIQNTDYQIPEQSDTEWGEYTTDLLEAIVSAVTGSFGPSDISETEITINNNATGATTINGLNFDTATVRGAFVEYTIYRTSATGEFSEAGVIQLSYTNGNSSGEKWELQRMSNNDAGVTVTVTDSGQAQYTSTDMGASGYNGVMTFRSRAILS